MIQDEIMKLQTYKMFEGEDTVYVERDDVLEVLKQEPCEDAISRAEAQTEIEMNACRYTLAKERDGMGQVEWSDQLIKVSDTVDIIRNLPSVKPLEQEPILNKIRAEIGISKTEYETQIAEKDIRAKLLISNIYCDIVNILDKYKAESEE